MPFWSLIRPGTGWGESVACFLRAQLPLQPPAAVRWQPPGPLHLRPGGIGRALQWPLGGFLAEFLLQRQKLGLQNHVLSV